jgi:hypothetical protein
MSGYGEDCPLPGLNERQLTRKLPLRMEISEAIVDPTRLLKILPYLWGKTQSKESSPLSKSRASRPCTCQAYDSQNQHQHILTPGCFQTKAARVGLAWWPGTGRRGDRKGSFSFDGMELSQEIATEVSPNPIRCRLYH